MVKYASASRAWIDVRHADGRLTVSVRDDGKLRIDSPLGHGTLLVAAIPSPAGDTR